MGLAEFKTIFWWEWIHRLWGRIIGLVYVLPLAWFWVRGLLPRWSKPWLLLGLVLGGLQGFVGWFMVHSGFIQGLTDVSQYRLALHLGLALFLYAYVFILGLALLNPDMRGMPRAGCHQRQLILGLVLVSITLISGAFVAGLNAGKLYNEYPLMGQGLVPTEYSELKPWLRNWFDNPAAVQFNHRWLAFATAAVSLWLALFWGLRQATGTARRFYTGLLVLVLCQFGLGIATLLSAVPVWLGALHQAGALLVLLVYCALVYAAFKPRSYL